MSLLIDALKKHRSTSVPSLAQVGGDSLASLSSNKTKKIILISLITISVIALTAATSFFIFKHIEKKHMAQMIQGKLGQAQNVKAMLQEKMGETSTKPGDAEDSNALRQKLMQKIQQRHENESPTSSSSPPSSSSAAPVSSPAETANNAAPMRASASMMNTASSVTETPGASNQTNETPRDRFMARKEGGADTNNQTNDTNNNKMTRDTSSTSEPNEAVSDDTSSDSSDNSSDNSGVKVDVQVVPNTLGADNPIYQKALKFMELGQYDKALSLLEGNDDLLLKTQGLSAALLARIYLTTQQYELADQVLDHALLLHVGSELDLLGLRAQTLFMQKKYQETVELLSSQSPDLTTSPEYYALLADAYMHLDQADNAVSIFQQIVARFPNSPNYWLGLAVAYQKTGDASSAIVAYRRAAQLSSDDPQVTLFINQQLQTLQET